MSRVTRGSVFHPALDIALILTPWAIAGAFAFGSFPGAGAPMAVWIAQFVAGNTSHVILTFLMLALRTDVLRATAGQARTVVVGSLVTFALTVGILGSVGELAPNWSSFPLAVFAIFGIHHRLSQAKGVWSLYNLRAGKLGLAPPTPAERSLQKHWVSVGLLAVCISWLFVPTAPGRMFSQLTPIPLDPAILPYEVAYGLAGGWVLFVLALLVTVVRAGATVPKLLHLLSHGAAVTLAILSPTWGAIVWGCIHGLEYYFLCGKMIQRREGEGGPSRLMGIAWMALAMAPIWVVGLAMLPIGQKLFAGSWLSYAVPIVNGVVAAHYFADAFIYRFRIPEVRQVALRRLGFA